MNWTYVLRRLGGAALTLLVVAFAVFTLMHLMPYNLAGIMAGPGASPAQVAAVASSLGLDLPLPLQFLRWLGQLGAGGLALAAGQALPTLELLGLGSALALAFALGLAYLQVRWPGSALDRVASSAAYVLYTLPSLSGSVSS